MLLSQKRLLRDISHELRSPLARLNELIGQLMTLTILETGVQDQEKTNVDLPELLQAVTIDADFEAGSRNCRVILASACEKGTVVHGSQELLRRAFENVIRNGVRYTGENTEVEISCLTVMEGDERRAVIAVRDHGPGYPEWCLHHIFKPFFRVAEARDRQSDGTGIGLAIAERAVRLHGGSMTASNAEGGGLIVTIALPLADNKEHL